MSILLYSLLKMSSLVYSSSKYKLELCLISIEIGGRIIIHVLRLNSKPVSSLVKSELLNNSSSFSQSVSVFTYSHSFE